MRTSISVSLASAAFIAALTLSGCAGSTDAASNAAHSEAAGHEAPHAESPLALESGWAKAADGMSGVFGTLNNASDAEVTLVSATSEVAGVVELHESISSGADTTMREVEGGFSIPAAGSFELAPGGNHIMLMQLASELLPGDEVPVTLTFDDGTTVEVTVLAKSYGGAQENYEGDDDDAHAGH